MIRIRAARRAARAVRVLCPLVLVVSACSPGGDSREARPTTALKVEGRANANVSMAAAGRFVAAIWSATDAGGTADVYAAVSADGGRSFGDPVRVNSLPGDVRVNAEQPPRLALSPRPGAAPEIAVIWTARSEGGTRLLTARSRDGGQSFDASRIVPGSDAAGNRGWESIAAAPDGRFVAAWLDHRLLASSNPADAGHAHGGPGGHAAGATADRDGVAAAQLSQIYVGSTDGTLEARGVTGGVCYCCKTAIAVASDSVLLAWRHVYPGNMRDIAFTRSQDGGRTFATPVRISEDNWHLEGCPDDGPTMGLDQERMVFIVWPSVIEEASGPVKSLFLSTSPDETQFTARQQLPTKGQAHHPQIAVAPDGSFAVVWDESGTGTRQLAAVGGRRRPGGVIFGSPVRSGDVGMYPVVVWADGGWLRAWTSGDPNASVVNVGPLTLSD